MASDRQVRAWVILAVAVFVLFLLVGACSEVIEAVAEIGIDQDDD